jgi:signal transduction histidine kinase
MEKLRLKIASDLHDEVGSTLTKVSMRAQMLEMQINGEKESNNLKRISEQAIDAVSTMQDIVWAIDSRNDNAENLINKIKDTVFSMLVEKNIKVDFEITGLISDLKVPLEVRQNIYLIIKEAVHNITKHSNADSAKIYLCNSTEKLELIISDNGNNYYQKEFSTGQGLKNIEMRAEKIKGKVEYVKENGFKIVLSAPPIK